MKSLRATNPKIKPAEKGRTYPALVLKPGHFYAHGEITDDKQHHYCRGCDIFWPVGYECDHFDSDGCMKPGVHRDR
jgi:hypothetical protein